jgi:hypothetical protein
VYDHPRYRFLAGAAYDKDVKAPALPAPTTGRREMSKAIRRLFKTKLHCSFCGKSEHDVAKLVAGPNVFICDACVAICVDVMDNGRPSAPPSRVLGLSERVRGWFDRLRRDTVQLVEVGK